MIKLSKYPIATGKWGCLEQRKQQPCLVEVMTMYVHESFTVEHMYIFVDLHDLTGHSIMKLT